jgi:threonine dehydrogenase-like Zn-dependent dehydrogenase
MNALILTGQKNITLKDLPLPLPDTDEVLIETSYCALCKTDAKMWSMGHRDLNLPVIPGHEVIGKIKGENGFYAIWPGKSCGTCQQCLQGKENLCTQMKITGFHVDGGLAEYIKVPRSSLIKLPDGTSPQLAVLAEPLACGINALEQLARHGSPGSLLIVGGGTVGLMLAVGAINQGHEVVIVEKESPKIELIKAITEQAGIKVCRDSSGLKNQFDYAVNAAPGVEAFKTCMESLKSDGTLSFFSGLVAELISAKAVNEIHYRQLTVTGAYGCTKSQMEKALNLIAKEGHLFKLMIERFITLGEVPDVLPLVLSGTRLKFVVEFKDD